MMVKGIHYPKKFDYKFDPHFIMSCLYHGNYDLYEIVDGRLSLISVRPGPTLTVCFLHIGDNIPKINFWSWWRSTSYSPTWWFMS